MQFVGNFRSYKKNCASYPGELPEKLLIEFALFLAALESKLNQGFRYQIFSQPWRRAYVQVIPEVRT